MRRLIYFSIELLLCSSALGAQDQAKLAPAQQDVVKVSLAIRDATLRRDMESWTRYVADDCIFSTDDGALATKAQAIERYRKMPADYDHSVNPRDFVVRLHGDTAVTNYRITAHEQFTDADIISEMRVTETYIKQNGSWLLIAKQWGNLPVNFHKPVAVDASAYKDYVGQYQWRPLDSVETVSLKDGRLWTHFGKEEDEEYLPLSPDAFFVKDDIGSAQFVRDSQGKVTGYTYHRWDGQEIHVKKIK
jgi:ketosteroid isomerase-like protein